jgi:soluble cytochrome b562
MPDKGGDTALDDTPAPAPGCLSFRAGQPRRNSPSVPAFQPMKSRLLCLALALTVCLPAGRAQEETTKKKAEETELSRTMEKLNGAWRKLRRQAADPASNAASLELVATIMAGGEKALTLTPARVEDVPAADREKFVRDYQQKMKELLVRLGKLEEAFKAGDNTAAQDLVKKIGDLQKEAHKEFKRPDK